MNCVATFFTRRASLAALPQVAVGRVPASQNMFPQCHVNNTGDGSA